MPADPTASSHWQALARLATGIPSLTRLLDSEPDRFETQLVQAPGLRVDLSRQRWNAPVREALLALATEADLDRYRKTLFTGNTLNPTEGRAVLHTLLRQTAEPPVVVDGRNLTEEVAAARARMRQVSEAVRNGDWRGGTGRAIRDVVNIGIGGSFLGPALICDALGPSNGPRVHFLANIDGAEATRILAELDPERTLFVIASKSFGTLETRINATTCRSWFLERGGRIADIPRHFVAISTNLKAAAEFGLPEANLLPLWDWVGGRFSVWSPIGLPIALAHGDDSFQAFLDGARALDLHFRDAPLAENAPVLLALVELWNQAFLGTHSLAVLPYASDLARLPDYLQQLEMESNGKRVRVDGTPLSIDTGTILWGNVGTNGQHAYHQLLHQGTQDFSAEFILPLRTRHQLAEHHAWLAAHCFAQAEALARGVDAEQITQELMASGMDAPSAAAAAPHRVLPGNHPSTMVLLDDLGPQCLGALLALHEHKVFVQGILWGINSFDQWGVELGKKLGDRIHEQIIAARGAGDGARRKDATTDALVELFRQVNADAH
ncbi:MAG: glucose-6-phosphate isomerase [Pseudomonadales bacterium]|jgi:glucose-6-phosphate isomerase|nr:glucose-6-phosphate isomerase [Pseudomonadales bacterium]